MLAFHLTCCDFATSESAPSKHHFFSATSPVTQYSRLRWWARKRVSPWENVADFESCSTKQIQNYNFKHAWHLFKQKNIWTIASTHTLFEMHWCLLTTYNRVGFEKARWRSTSHFIMLAGSSFRKITTAAGMLTNAIQPLTTFNSTSSIPSPDQK